MTMNKNDKREKVIEVLNKARAMELTAISQYMNQHYGLDDMDYGDLAKNMKLIAIDEMRHAEQFAERIKELGGEPVAEADAKTVRDQAVKEIFGFDTNLEDVTIEAYNEYLLTCRECGDSISVKLFETIVEEEQEHFNYFDSVNSHIDNLGDQFLARIAGTPASTGLAHQGFVIANGGGE